MKKEARTVKCILIGEKDPRKFIDFEMVVGSGQQDMKSVYFFSKQNHSHTLSNIKKNQYKKVSLIIQILTWYLKSATENDTIYHGTTLCFCL